MIVKLKSRKFAFLIGIFMLFSIGLINNVSANPDTIPPVSYLAVYYPNQLDFGDKLTITIDSDRGITIYIMNNEHFNSYSGSGGIEDGYYKKWTSLIYLYTSFIVTETDWYYIVMENPSLVYDAIVSYDLDIDYYTPQIIYTTQHDYTGWLFTIILGIALVSSIIPLAVKLSHKKSEVMRLEQELTRKQGLGNPISEVKNCCHNCGKETPIGTNYCTSCGVDQIK